MRRETSRIVSKEDRDREFAGKGLKSPGNLATSPSALFRSSHELTFRWIGAGATVPRYQGSSMSRRRPIAPFPPFAKLASLPVMLQPIHCCDLQLHRSITHSFSPSLSFPLLVNHRAKRRFCEHRATGDIPLRTRSITMFTTPMRSRITIHERCTPIRIERAFLSRHEIARRLLGKSMDLPSIETLRKYETVDDPCAA